MTTYNPDHDLNYEELERFIGIVYEPEDWLEFRAIRPNRGRGTVSCFIGVDRFINDRPATITQWLDSHHTPNYAGMYLGVNPRFARSTHGPNRAGNENDVSTFRCAFCDLDNCSPSDAVELYKASGLPDPTLIVHSGRATGTHLYWRFDEPMDRETWEGVQRAIQKRLNGDSMKDAPRVMRAPGSFNFTRNNNARILREGPRYESFNAMHLEADEMIPPTFAVADPGIEFDERNLNYSTRRYLEAEHIPEGGNEIFDGRNSALFSAACDFVANGSDYDETCERLMPLAVDRDGLPEYESKRTISNAVRRNPTRTLMVNVTGVDETWTKFMSEPQSCGKGVPPQGTEADEWSQIPEITRTIRPATEQERIDLARMRGEVDLPDVEDEEADDSETDLPVGMTELSIEEAERIQYEEELADIQRWELSAPPLVSNYSVGVLEPQPGESGKPQQVKMYRSAEQVLEDIRDGFSGWPKYAPGMGLFGYRPHGEDDEIVHGLPTPASMFAFLKATGQVRWTNEPTIYRHMEVTRELRPLKENEAFELLKERCPNRYRGFCQIPHFPAIEGFYYPKYELPEPSKDLVVLQQFLNALNPETAVDKHLLTAALLTPAWGGPPGSRPLFVLCSEHGQGSGKTETVKAMSSIWGGYYPLSLDKTWADNAKMLMSSDDWLTRICLWDNVKTKFSGAEVEGAVTSEMIQGHRMYVGTVKRYNDVSFFMTVNNPELSRDIAQRAVVIKMGAPKSGNFTDWWRSFMAENRRQLIADALAVLKRTPQNFDFAEYPDRWRAWQQGVLARIPGVDLTEIMELTVSRRGEVDSDTSEGEQIIRGVASVLPLHEPGRTGVQDISLLQIRQGLISGGMWNPDNKNTAAQDARKLASFVIKRTAALGVLKRVSRAYVTVNDEGVPTGHRGVTGTRRSPKWTFDWDRAKEIVGNEWGVEAFTTSQPGNERPDPSNQADLDDLPV